MENRYISIDQHAVLHYKVWGNGPKNIVCFHGYGQNSDVYKFLVDKWSERFTFYSLDLFFHGNSTLKRDKSKSVVQQWQDIFNSFLYKEGLNKFSLLGYSIGCRPLLYSMASFQDRIEQVYLIAPDGITSNFWFSVATSFPGSLLFKKLIQKPEFILRMAGALHKFRLLDRALFKLADLHLRRPGRRERLYNTWMWASKFNLSTSKMIRIIKESHIRFYIIYSLKDKLIDDKAIRRFATNSAFIKTYPSSLAHEKLLGEFTEVIAELLGNKE